MHSCPVGNASRLFLSIGVFFVYLLSAYAQSVDGPVQDSLEQLDSEGKVSVLEKKTIPDIDREDPDFWIHKIYAWRMAIESHTPGMADAAAVAVGRWEEEDLRRMMFVVEELTAEKGRSSSYSYITKDTLNGLSRKTAISLLRFNESRDLILKWGVLLHTDIVLLQLEKGNKEYFNQIIRIDDGRGAARSMGRHMEYARRLLSLFSSDPWYRELKRQWYISTTAFLMATHDYAYSEANLQYAMNIYPSDTAFLFYTGTIHENYALPKFQNALIPSWARSKLDSEKSQLKQARTFFKKAIEVDPNSSEIRLHLGRVLGLLGDHDRSVDVLQQASGFLIDPRLRYYCSLFLGKELTILNRYEEARIQYERAALLYPAAQSPLLGLSRLDHINGNSKNALLGVGKAMALPDQREISEDPWWFYDVSHVRDASELIKEMYKGFGEQP